MINYTISKVEAMFRIQRLFANSNVRFFNVGEVNASQLTDVVGMFQDKYNILADKNERKRLERAGEPIWHCVLWYDYVNIGRMHYYLMSTGYTKPKDPKKAFDVVKRNQEFVAEHNLKDIYSGEHLTFGRYILGQYIDYESPYDKNTKGFPKEHRHPEQFKEMLVPSLFNYVRTGNYYSTFKERMDKIKRRYMTEQHNIVPPTLTSKPIDQTDSELHTEMDENEELVLNIEADKELIGDDNEDITKSPEYIAADKIIRKARYDQFMAVRGYASYELNPTKDIEILTDAHPNFRSDLNYEEIRERMNNEINGLYKRVERISREHFINQLSPYSDAKKLHNMSHQGLKDMWLSINKRRIHLHYNRLCEDRTRTVRWTWYVRKNTMFEFNQQMKNAIKHMNRGGDEFVNALSALYRMAGFHGVRHQIGRMIAKAKRDAKHAFPKVFNGLEIPNKFGYVTTIPITIFTCKQFHDECITASIKHLHMRKVIEMREQQRGKLREALRAESEHFAKMPTYALDKHINEQFQKWVEVKITAEDLFDFLRRYDDMNPKHLNFSRFKDLEKDQIDVDVIFDRFERRITAIHNGGQDGDTEADIIQKRKRKKKVAVEDNVSEAEKTETDDNETKSISEEIDAELKSDSDEKSENDAE